MSPNFLIKPQSTPPGMQTVCKGNGVMSQWPMESSEMIARKCSPQSRQKRNRKHPISLVIKSDQDVKNTPVTSGHVRGGKVTYVISAREKPSQLLFNAISRGDNKSKHTVAISPRVLLTTVIHLEDARRHATLKRVVFHPNSSSWSPPQALRVCTPHIRKAMSKGGRTKSKCKAGVDEQKYFLPRIRLSIRPNRRPSKRSVTTDDPEPRAL